MAQTTRVIRRHFLAGLIALLPLVLTLYLFRLLVSFVGSLSAPFIGPLYNRFLGADHPLFYHELTGFILTLLFVTLAGFLVNNLLFGRRLMLSFERLFTRIPFLSGTYVTLRKLTDFFSPGAQRRFEQVVLVRFPRDGSSYAIGFVTSESPKEMAQKTGENLINVFVPTTPNPTSGFLLFVKREEMVPLSLSVDDAVKLIISGGIAVPEGKAAEGKSSGAPG